MGLITAVVACLRKTVDFRGRARRSEFWCFAAFWVAAAVVCTYAVNMPDGPAPASTYVRAVLTTPAMLVPLTLLVPLAAVAVRRMHDVNLSGWWLLSIGIPLPVIDAVVVGAQVFCFARRGTPGDNRYGPDPRRSE